MKRLGIADMHTHIRWREAGEYPFASVTLEHARKVGMVAIGAMPNTTPALDKLDVVGQWCEFLGDVQGLKIYTHLGMTTDPLQVESAIRLLMKPAARASHGLLGDKVFYAGSTNHLGITDEDYHRWIWFKKASLGYTGVSLGHHEEQTLFTGLYQPDNPASHSDVQNPTAETISVERQLRNAHDAKFKGTMYVCHTTNFATVLLVEQYRRRHPQGVRVVMEVTPHHLFLSTDDYVKHGNWVRCNPPLRSPQMQQQLLALCLAGRFDTVGSDHAPHPPAAKTRAESPASGIPSLPFWPKCIELLMKAGATLNLIDQLTFYRPREIFGLHINVVEVDVEYDPSLWDAYKHNPFDRVDGTT